MKVLILNSGMGSRMEALTKAHPKCMTPLSPGDTILSRQLRQIAGAGLTEVVMTVGYREEMVRAYCASLALPLHIKFASNPRYETTNYIYSIDCARALLDDDLLLMHGDLVFEDGVFSQVCGSQRSCMAVSTTLPLPEKDFKAVVRDGRIQKIGVSFFEDAVAAQPLYKLNRADWAVWLAHIHAFTEAGEVNCYAENAFNEISGECPIFPLDVRDDLCAEIDTAGDLQLIAGRLGAAQE